MIIPTQPLSEVTQQALAVLIKEIGVVNTVRFLISSRRDTATTPQNATRFSPT